MKSYEETYEEMALEAETIFEAGTEFEGLVPVRARVAENVGAVFSFRISPDELTVLIEAARQKGQRIDDFIRLAALAAARGQADEEATTRSSALDDLRSKAAAIVEAVERLGTPALQKRRPVKEGKTAARRRA